MTSNANILAKYGLNADGRKQASSTATVSATAQTSSTDILAKYGLNANGRKQESGPATTPAATSSASLATERADEADKMMVPSDYRQHQQALATERADEADKMLVPSKSRQEAQQKTAEKKPIRGPIIQVGEPYKKEGMHEKTLTSIGKSIWDDSASALANLGGTLLHLGNRLNYQSSSTKRQIDNAIKARETYTKNRDAVTLERSVGKSRGKHDYQ